MIWRVKWYLDGMMRNERCDSWMVKYNVSCLQLNKHWAMGLKQWNCSKSSQWLLTTPLSMDQTQHISYKITCIVYMFQQPPLMVQHSPPVVQVNIGNNIWANEIQKVTKMMSVKKATQPRLIRWLMSCREQKMESCVTKLSTCLAHPLHQPSTHE